MNNKTTGSFKARFAAMRYRHPDRGLRLITIAGQYGKTTTARLLSEILQEANQSVLTLTNQGCYLNGTRQPLSYDTNAKAILRCLAYARRQKAAVVIIEVTDRLLESHVLATLTIDMAVVTSDAPSAHAVLNQPLNYAVIPSGFEIDGVNVAPHQVISFGEDESAEAQLKSVTLYRKGTEVELTIDHQTNLTLSTYLIGKANACNIAAAVAAAYIMPVPTSVFEEGVARLETVLGNYSYVTTEGVYSVAVDRATSQQSVELVVAAAEQLKKRRLIIVLDETVKEAGFEAAKRASDRLIVVGKEGDGVAGISFEPTPSEAVTVALRGAKKDDLVLFIGLQFGSPENDEITSLQRMIEATGEQ